MPFWQKIYSVFLGTLEVEENEGLVLEIWFVSVSRLIQPLTIKTQPIRSIRIYIINPKA